MKKIYLKIFSLTLCVLLTLPLICFPSAAEEEDVGAYEDMFYDNIPRTPDMTEVTSAYVYNIENDKEILSYNGNAKIFPSSLTKIAAFSLASEMLADRLDEKITVTDDMLKGTVGTYVGIEAGEIFTVRELFYIAFCGGFNDAVNIIANVCSGSVSAFVSEMNKKAVSLGASATVFTNPTGIHNPSMYTTMNDLSRIVLHASKDPLVMQVTSTVKIEFEKSADHDRYMLYNKNMLLSDRTTSKYINKYASGLNAGSTAEGGECLATMFTKDGLSYLCIVVGGKEIVTDKGEKYISSYRLANDLSKWCFDSFGYVTLFDPSVPCAELSVKYGLDVDAVSVIPDGEITMYLPLSFDTSSLLDLRTRFFKTDFEAPMKKGDVVGRMTVLYEGHPIGEVALKITKDIEKDSFAYTLDMIKIFSQNRVFLLTVVCAVGYTVIFSFGAFLLSHLGGGRSKSKKNTKKVKR